MYQQVSQPATLTELQQLVRNQKRLRAFASTRDSKILLPSESYFSMAKFNRILYLTSTSVTCEPSVTVTDLLTYLAVSNNTLQALPQEQHTTIGGVILGCKYNGIVELNFVTASGQLLAVNSASPYFQYAAVSAGMLGVLYSCTLKIKSITVEHLLYQKREYCNLPLDPIGWLKGGLYRKLCYNPYSGKALLYDHSHDSSFGYDRSADSNKWFRGRGVDFIELLHDNLQVLTPFYIDAFYKSGDGRCSGKAYDVLGTGVKFSNTMEFEGAVPVGEACAVLEQIRQLIFSWKDDGYYLYFGFEMALRERDNHPLSLAYQTDVISFKFLLYYSEGSKEFVTELQDVIGGRFHIGKYSSLSLDAHNGWADFEVVRAVIDGGGKFYV